MHRFLLHNDNILDAHEKSLSAGQVGLMNGWGVFSTLRVADGVLFAFERHWERMHRDAAKVHVPFPTDPAELKSQLLRLVEANSAFNSTLRVMVVRNRGGIFEGPDMERDFDVLGFTKDLNPWGDSVRLTIKAERALRRQRILRMQDIVLVPKSHVVRRSAAARLRRSGAVERARRSERMHVGEHLCRHWRRSITHPRSIPAAFPA